MGTRRPAPGTACGQELHHLEHVVGEVVGIDVQCAPQGERSGLVRARGAPQAEIDAPGEQRLQRAKLLGHLQRRVVRQHDAPGADPDARGARPHVADEHGGGRAADPGHVVMLGQPEPPVAQLLRVLRQLQRVPEGLRRRAALKDGSEIEN
jgi:hypothetical protein